MNSSVTLKELPFQDRRSEKRLIIDFIILPFLGSREDDHICFEYLLLDISTHGVKIAIPKWVISREWLKENDLINFHIPFQLNKKTFNQGRIVWTRWDDTLNAQICGAHFEKKTPIRYPIFISLVNVDISFDLQDFSSVEDLLFRVIKDSILLKKGVLIYLNHLSSYFSRITQYPSKDYPLLKESVLNDIRNKVKENQRKLENLYEKIHKEVISSAEIPKFIDLEELRTIMESEIYVEIFKTTFESDTPIAYLLAIKELEKKLYFNYNNIVMIYVRSL